LHGTVQLGELLVTHVRPLGEVGGEWGDGSAESPIDELAHRTPHRLDVALEGAVHIDPIVPAARDVPLGTEPLENGENTGSGELARRAESVTKLGGRERTVLGEVEQAFELLIAGGTWGHGRLLLDMPRMRWTTIVVNQKNRPEFRLDPLGMPG
jgi:hypothetical protein